MPFTNTRERWGIVSKTLHWLVVALLLGMAWLGLTMGDMPHGPDKVARYALHKSLGVTVLALVILRLGWRLYAGAPAPVAGARGWRHVLAKLMHRGLYALLLAMPISGWLLNSAAGFPLQWFGLVNLPAIAGRDEALRELAGNLHEWLFWTLALLASLHAAAGLYHHLFLRDATLARMLPDGWLRVDAPERESRDA